MKKQQQSQSSLSRDRKLTAQRSSVKIINQARPIIRQERMSGIASKTVRGYFHNGKFVWG